MRLDHYLPTLKRAKKADRKPPGPVRRVLERIGPTMAAAPLRRVIQGICFITFLVSFFYVCWPYTAKPASNSETPATEAALDALLAGEKPWPSHYADDLMRKEVIPADLFLRIDPLVSLSTGIASRSWVYSLASAGIILLVCVFIPRGFCGYLCPLGTLIDLFDWIVGRRVKRFRVAKDGWWVHIKYYVLLGTLIAAACGVLISGFFAAIPVITRGMLFFGEPLQTGLLREWHLVVPFHAGHVFSLLLFFGVLGLGLLRPRFWCKYVCPSGAVFSIANLFRVTERKVEDSCIQCRKCVDICPFDAIKPDFTTRTTDCTLCQTCGGVCPSLSIKFVDRWDVMNLKKENEPPTHETPLGRRGFVSLATGSALAVTGGVAAKAATSLWGADLDNKEAFRPVRPPGSVPEKEFLQMCIRCGECFKACPNNVLHAEGFEQGFEGLWTPMVKADWAGCESSCNACGQVCPTGAIQPLPLEVKKKTRMALAEVNLQTCLPHAGKEACQLCVDDCAAAGYNAIEFLQVHTKTDKDGNPVEGTGFVAPVVLADKCVGCGLCQTRCFGINVLEKGLLKQSAIIIAAGEGKEDRHMPGNSQS
jgi:polyferredoxin